MKKHTLNRMLIQGFKKNGVEVIECHQEIWKDVPQNYHNIVKIGNILKILLFTIVSYIKLIFKFIKIKDKVSAIFVTHPVYFDVIPARLLSSIFKKPLYTYLMISLYDTFIEDRKIFKKTSFFAKIVRFIDYVNCKLSDILFIDTPQNAVYLQRNFGVSLSKVVIVPCSTDYEVIERVKDLNEGQCKDKDEMLVIYHGYFIPLHGVNYILETAKLLRGESFKFVLIGDGQELRNALEFARKERLHNVNFVGRLPFEELIKELKKGDVLLGVFGKGDKTQRVVPFKVYTALALGKCLVTAWTRAIEEAGFINGVHLIGVPPGDALAIAEALKFLKEHPEKREEVANNARSIFVEKFLPEKVVKPIVDRLQ